MNASTEQTEGMAEAKGGGLSVLGSNAYLMDVGTQERYPYPGYVRRPVQWVAQLNSREKTTPIFWANLTVAIPVRVHTKCNPRHCQRMHGLFQLGCL
jgi:hypothetical protein